MKDRQTGREEEGRKEAKEMITSVVWGFLSLLLVLYIAVHDPEV